MLNLTQSYESLIAQDKYFTKLVSQLNKDFNDNYFDEQSLSLTSGDANQLEENVRSYIIKLFEQSSDAFFQIMYRIDIPESNFKTTLLLNGIDFELLTTLILKREVLKILTREHFNTLQ